MQLEHKLGEEDAPLYIGELPFVFQYGVTPTNKQYGLPDSLPFFLDIDVATGLVKQTFNLNIAQILEKAYQQGSILSGVMDVSGIGERYAMDFFTYIKSIVPKIANKKILEIGCGTGYLLSLLSERGADVIGVEPGSQGENAESRFGVQVIRDFFPSNYIHGSFNVVIAYAVLEHLSDLSTFLQDIKKQLSHKGKVIFAVPNCKPYLQIGDSSCLFHEHWSYFTDESLKSILQKEGLKCLEIVESDFGGLLYCSACVVEESARNFVPLKKTQFLKNFYSKSNQMLSALSNLLINVQQKHESVGIYVPGRILNALSIIKKSYSVNSLRFFDDNEALHGKYFPCFPLPIENWDDFIDTPPDIVLIGSNTFGNEIRDRIESCTITKVVGWNDFF